MTLLRDIQNSAIDSNVRLSDLLRKCKVLATRLKNEELNKWVDAELNGYQSQDDLPPYRIIRCIAKGHFGGPFGAEMRNITIPASCLPEKKRAWAQSVHLIQPISSLEELVRSEGGNLQCEWPGDLIASVGNKIYKGYSLYAAWLSIPNGAIVAILDTVRNRILNFALEIEKEAPDAGEAPPNSKPIPEEQVSQIFNTIITGSVQNVATGSSNFTQSGQFTVSQGDFTSLSSFLKSQGVPEEDIKSLQEAIKEDDKEKQPQGFGQKVSAWIGKMLSKAGTVAWNISTSSAGTLLTRAVAQYYGFE
jgi:hypothetical protein